MPFPPNRRELKIEGYDYITTKTCPCGATMELWQTPRGAIIPMNPMKDDDSEAESHWSTCPKAAQFRRKSPAKVTADVTVEHPQKERSSQRKAEPTLYIGQK